MVKKTEKKRGLSKKSWLALLLIFFAGLIITLVILPRFSADGGTVSVGLSIPGAPDDFKYNYRTYVKALLNFAVNLLGPTLAILMIIYGGYRYLFSAGNKTEVEEGGKIIVGAILGYALLFLAKVILNILGVDFTV